MSVRRMDDPTEGDVTKFWNFHLDSLCAKKFQTLKYGPLFLLGGGGEGEGLPFLGLADNFFLKNNAFQTIFFH